MAFSLVLPYFADILPPSAVFRHTVRLLPVFIFSTVLPGYMSEYSVMVSHSGREILYSSTQIVHLRVILLGMVLDMLLSIDLRIM